jgi:hypothetical protein
MVMLAPGWSQMRLEIATYRYNRETRNEGVCGSNPHVGLAMGHTFFLLTASVAMVHTGDTRRQ